MEWRKGLTKVSFFDIDILKNRRLKRLKGGETMKQIWTFLLVLVLFSFSLSGCGYFAARNEIKAAEIATAELKGAGGATLAPYEYCSAESFLEISKFVLTENSWKVSKEFAARSKSAAEAGLAEVKKK
jgi:hypothetical protein